MFSALRPASVSAFACLASACLGIATLSVLHGGQARAEEAPVPPNWPSGPSYTLQVATYQNGELHAWSEVGLGGLQGSQRIASGDFRISPDGGEYFEWKYDSAVFVQTVDREGKPLSDFDLSTFSPAELTALENAACFRLADVQLKIFAPGSSEIELKLWRSDSPPPLPNEDGTMPPPSGETLDADGDGEPDPPGLYLGSLRWRVDSPDLGYLRDIDVTPEALQEMQYGQPGHIGGPPLARE
jgi:hypothetical protein